MPAIRSRRSSRSSPRQAIHRGSFASVDDLIAAIRRFIDAYNDRCEPFAWTKTPDEILAKLKPQTTSATTLA